MAECTDYLIVPPEQHNFDEPLVLEQIRTALVEAFPGWNFTITTEAPHKQEEDFIVMPADGKRPDSKTLERIAWVVVSFLNSGRAKLN